MHELDRSAPSDDVSSSDENSDAIVVKSFQLFVLQRMNILILDELDQACKAIEAAVQQIFNLSTLPSSRLVVIGIANRLDLAHRVLQPLGAHGRSQASPTIISFHSYTARQLLQLLQV